MSQTAPREAGTSRLAHSLSLRTLRRRTRRGVVVKTGGRFIHLVSAVILMLGLFSPIYGSGGALAAPATTRTSTDPRGQSSDTVIPSPTQVSIAGDFGQFDLTNFDGVWKGVFPVPAGSYSYQFVVIGSDGNQYAFGSGGLNGNSEQITIGDSDQGLYAEFNAHTYRTDAQSVAAVYTLNTNNGEIPLKPDGGNLSAIVNSQGGDFGYQLLDSGNPVGDQQTVSLDFGPVLLTVDTNGQVVNTQSLTAGSLVINRVDADGNPLAGGCYQVRSGGDIVNMGCDADDGSTDGSTYLTFPEGINPGNVTIVETTAADGQDAAPDTDFSLQPGDNSVTIQSEATEVETPTEEGTVEEPTQEGGDLGQPTEEVSPTEEGGGIFEAPTEESVATEEPTATEAPQPGDLIVQIQDQDGNAVQDSCFQLIDEDQNVVGESCDATDPTPNNGRVGFYGVPAGTYTLHLSQTPEGVDPVDDRQVTIEGGQETTETVDVNVAAPPTEEPTATEEPTLEPTLEPTEEPTLEPTAEPTEEPTQEPTLAPTDEPTEEEATAEPTLEPTEEGAPTDEAAPTETVVPTEGAFGDPGDLVITIVDQNGERVGETCFQLIDPATRNVAAESCDATDPTPNNGRVGFYGVPSGTYTLHLNDAPEGYAPVEDQEVTVVAGQETDLDVSLTLTAEPTEKASPTEEGVPTDEASPTEESAPTEVAPTEEPTSESDSDTGTVRVDVSAFDQSQTQICVELNTSGGIGLAEPPSACDNGDGDADSAPGTILIENVPAGEYTAYITQGPDDALNAPPIDIVATGGQETVANFSENAVPTAEPTQEPIVEPTQEPTLEPTLEPTVEPTQEPTLEPTAEPTQEPTTEPTPTEEPAGSILASLTDQDDQPVANACIAIDGGNAICDNSANDENSAPGQIQADNVLSGDHTVSVTDVPEGYEQPDDLPVQVQPDEVAAADITLDTAPVQTGSAEISLAFASDDESAIASFAQAGGLPDGLCVSLTDTVTNGVFGTICDNGDGDTEDAAGVIGVADIPVGSYVVSLTPESEQSIEGFQSANSPTLVVTADAVAQVNIDIVATPAATTGTVDISTRNNATNALISGACYELRPSGGGAAIPVCDNDAADQNGTNGVIRLIDVPEGTYDLVMTTTPAGFQAAANQQVTVTAGGSEQLEVRLDAVPQTSALTVNKIDDNGDSLKNACFQLRQGNTVLQILCDANDATPGDGKVIFENLAAGAYTVVETKAPNSTYQIADPVNVNLVAGVDQSIDVTNVAKTGRLVVTKVDADDANTILQNACFQLANADRTYGPYCDADDGTVDGKITFTDIIPGTYTLKETVVPSGYQKADDRDITINPAASVKLTVADKKAPPPAESGTLVVLKQTDTGKALPGGCFRLFDGNNPLTNQVCDNADGTNDAKIIFNKVPVGTWTLRETLAPSVDYQIGPDRQVKIENGKTTEVKFPNSLKTGRVQVKKVDQGGNPLQGACFDLAVDNAPAKCTDSTGTAIFTVPVGTYSMTETKSPAGYQKAAKILNIKVKPGQTTVVEVVDKLIPDPDTGSVQVLKFVCPTGDGQSRTQFLGGAAGNAQLAKTANCTPANAAFTLKAQSGSGGPGSFTTGTDGQYQVTVKSGLYTLVETDPDLPGNSQVTLKVVKGQLTTVVVINYIAPPKPAPATIQVTKYTCPSSFNGTLYDDFAQNCSDVSQLTNNVTVRVQGPTTQKHVTGDSGKKGQSTFGNLKAGTYTISEDRPFNIPVGYLFCGYDGQWPADFKAVNDSLTLDVQSGQTLTCIFFNIPEIPAKDTGTILVHKYICDVKAPPKGYDFESECRLSDQEVKFQASAYNTETQKFDKPTVVQANPDGLARFKNLKPGTYQLLEVNGKWCHAKSSSVDSKGNVVVKPNGFAEVWIYNCVEPKSPPNTGSGDAAGLLNPGGDTTGTGMLMSVAWPLLALGAWFVFRNRRQTPSVQTIRSNQIDRPAA